MIVPPCDNGTRAGLRPVPFGLPGSIPGGGVFIIERSEIGGRGR